MSDQENKSLILSEDHPSDLAVELTSSAIQALSNQRTALKSFIKSQLEEKVDYGTIPGTPKPTLYKPGAEKLANIFKLGSRIIDVQKELAMPKGEPGFAMFTYTIEIYHIPSNKSIAQCQGSANSEEKKYRKVAIGDQLNTLQKMAQKRAYVGAVMIAVGASDFFTQDLEDSNVVVNGEDDLNSPYILKYGRCKTKPINECKKEDLNSYLQWISDAKITAPKILEEREMVLSYLRDPQMYNETWNRNNGFKP